MNKITSVRNVRHYPTFIRKSMALILLLVGTVSTAQIQNFSFSQSAGTYQSITDATVVATATASSGTGNIDDQSYPLSNVIPFSFAFGGGTYTSLNVYANGFISFGSVTTNSYAPISDNTGYNAVISPMAADLNALYQINGLTGNISYTTTGTAPNREFIVQWEHFRPYSISASTTTYFDYSFQVRLKENGSISYTYDLKATGTPTSENIKVGLRGGTNADYINRMGSGTSTNNWAASVAGTSNSSGIITNSTSLPPAGLTFTWSPPAACVAPTAQPTNLVLTRNGIIINGTFTAATPAPDRYLILRTLAGTTHNAPVNGTSYATGANTSLNAYVVAYGTSTTFENNYNNGITGNNTYEYTIYAVSSNCSGGPLYLLTTPLTGSITNCPITLNSFTASNVTANGFQLNWTSENGTALPYAATIEVATNTTFTNMVTGSPFTVTAPATTLSVTGLTANTQYYFRGKNVSTCESVYSSVGNTFTSCLPVTDFSENFDGVSSTQLPNCWTKILASAVSSQPTINVTGTDSASQPNNVSFYGNGADTDLPTTKIILVSPQVTNLAAGTHRLRFKARKTSTATVPSVTALQIVALDGTGANANIEVIATFNELTTAYAEYNAYFSPYTGTANYIGIRRIGGPSYSYLYVDDISWEAVPSCTELATVTASNPTPNGATITWTNANGTAPANGYEYVVTTTNTAPAATATATPIATANVVLNTLPGGVTHYIWVRRICSATDKSAWKSTSFTTLLTAPAPWTEAFATTTTPAGWDTLGWTLGAIRGATGNPGTNLYKNLYANTATGAFKTIPVGPLTTNTYEFAFDYKQSAYATGYAPLATWGSFEVQVSTDFGTTWTPFATVTNEAGTGSYLHKVYSLAAYQGAYVQFKVTATRTDGDFDLSFDNFSIQVPAPETTFCLPVFEYGADSNGITNVTFNTINNESPFAAGTPVYEDFTTIATVVNIGATYPISVKGPSSSFPSDVMAYIDFNQNGLFENDTESFYLGRLEPANPANANTITANITIPANALEGTTKMRIVKNTNINALSNPDAANSIHSACDPTLRAGQTEDYTVTVGPTLHTGDFDSKGFRIYPNPTSGIITVQSNTAVKVITVFNTLGQQISSQQSATIDLSAVAPGMYLIQVILQDGTSSTQKIIRK